MGKSSWCLIHLVPLDHRKLVEEQQYYRQGPKNNYLCASFNDNSMQEPKLSISDPSIQGWQLSFETSSQLVITHSLHNK